MLCIVTDAVETGEEGDTCGGSHVCEDGRKLAAAMTS